MPETSITVSTNKNIKHSTLKAIDINLICVKIEVISNDK